MKGVIGRVAKLLSTDLESIKQAAYALRCLDGCVCEGEACVGRGKAGCYADRGKSKQAHETLMFELRSVGKFIQYCECGSAGDRAVLVVTLEERNGKLAAFLLCRRCGKRVPFSRGNAMLNRAMKAADALSEGTTGKVRMGDASPCDRW